LNQLESLITNMHSQDGYGICLFNKDLACFMHRIRRHGNTALHCDGMKNFEPRSTLEDDVKEYNRLIEHFNVTNHC